MRSRFFLVLLAALAAMPACGRKITVSRDPPELRKITDDLRLNRQRQLWRYKHKRGRLPNLDHLAPLEPQVQKRVRPSIPVDQVDQHREPDDQGPLVPHEQPYLVIVPDDRNVRNYDGIILDPRIEAGRITGRLANPNVDVTIHYQTPNRIDYSPLDTVPNLQLRMRWLKLWIDGSDRERAYIAAIDPDTGVDVPLLGYYAWGTRADRLIDDWDVPVGIINVRQTLVRADGIAKVGVDRDNPDDSGLPQMLPGIELELSDRFRVYCMSSVVQPISHRAAIEGAIQSKHRVFDDVGS